MKLRLFEPALARSNRSRYWVGLLVLGLFSAAFPFGAAAAGDVSFADFEGTDYGGWTATGTAFGPGPARGTLPGQMRVSGFRGAGLVNSFYGGDDSMGTLTSPPFKIERRAIHFLIGGGGWAGKTCMNLLVEGRIVRTAAGPNTVAGGSEELQPGGWDVGEFLGRNARLEIVDKAKGGWGHINVDAIAFSDRKPPVVLENATRDIVLEKRFLNLPVKTGAPKHRMALLIDGKSVREFEIELAPAEPDFWVFLEVAAWHGKKATLRVDKWAEGATGLAAADQSEVFRGADSLYREALRPQFHFSPRRGWNNDPNGLVYSHGEYHLYFQHNPYGWNWGNMHWGHAVSSDLVHWEELPTAMYPREFGDWVFSGSAVADKRNTSGWKTGGNELLVAAFTSTGRGECIVFSNDHGRTWTEYEGNPVVKHQGRDPKLVWHEPTHQWVMALYDESENRRWITFHTSPDLKHWTYQSRIGGFFECPDLFELPVDGNPANRKWVLTAASSEYRIGQFDGKTFTPETSMLPGHRGKGFYAAQTYSDIPDGRRIQIGWGQMPTPGMAFNQMMCFPCELTLRTTPDGVRLHFQPVTELKKLHGKSRSIKDRRLSPGDNPLRDMHAELLDIQAEFEPGDAKEFGFRIRGSKVAYDTARRELVCNGHPVPLQPVGGKVRLQILSDRTSIEVFANDGAVFIPMPVLPKPEDRSLEIFAEGGSADARRIDVYELKPIWRNKAPEHSRK
jgi:fructan beta-fructosidase